MLAAAWWMWLLPLAFGSPWIVALAYFWPKMRRDGHVPPSLAELVRERLWTR